MKGYSFMFRGLEIHCDSVEDLDAFIAFREERP